MRFLNACSALVTQKFSDNAELSQAASAALNAICAFNRESSVSYLRESVSGKQGLGGQEGWDLL